jgi:hypothetical protein
VLDLEMVPGYLAAYTARMAGRAASEADRHLDASLERLHALVSQKLGDDDAVQRCDREAATEGVLKPRTVPRVQRAIEEAVEADPAFAAALRHVLDELRAATAQLKGYDRPQPRAGRYHTGQAEYPSDRRPPAGSARPGRGGGQRPRAETGDARYRDGDERLDRDARRPERDQAARFRDYESPRRRPRRYGSGPVQQPSDSQRPGADRDHGSRRAGYGRNQHEARSGMYDTDTLPRLATDSFSSGPTPAADFPSGEFPSAPMPAAYAPPAGYPGAGFHSDEFPSNEFPSEPLPVADFPSGKMPAARARGRSASPKSDPGKDRPDSRRKPAKAPDGPKGRSRQQRAKRDDDDWPSSKWDELSDEQYWAELSSDKPLATTARSPQPASEPKPTVARSRQFRSAAAKPELAAPVSQPAPPAAEPARGRDLPSRRASNPRREAAAQRETVTEQPTPAQGNPYGSYVEPAPASYPSIPPVGHQDQQAGAGFPAYPGDHVGGYQESAYDPAAPLPHPGPPAAGFPVHPSDAGQFPPPAAHPEAGYPEYGGYGNAHPGGESDAPGRPAGALNDDPLTSPSFSRPTQDSRFYRNARKNTQASDTGSRARSDDQLAAASCGTDAYGAAGYGDDGPQGQVSGAYQVPPYTQPGSACQSATQPLPADAQQPAGRYSGPEQHTPGQGNPYGSYAEPAASSYPSIPPAGYQGQQPAAGFPAYPGDQAGGYTEPGHEPAASVPHPGPPTGAVDDDPLTSPSFSRPTLDSQSYSSARKNASATSADAATAYPGRPAGAHPRTAYASGQIE